MSLSKEEMMRFAELSITAEKTAAPIEPFTNKYPSFTAWEAYEIQKLRNHLLCAEGKEMIGAKWALPAWQSWQNSASTHHRNTESSLTICSCSLLKPFAWTS